MKTKEKALYSDQNNFNIFTTRQKRIDAFFHVIGRIVRIDGFGSEITVRTPFLAKWNMN